MTTQTDAGAPKSFVNARLPWIVAALAGVVYLLTLNHWICFENIEPYARATHQTWFTDPFTPVFSLVTSPFRWLPETSVPIALNIFSTFWAAIVLALLARSVTLLPHDRTHKQREREKNPFGLLSLPTAWIPPVLAVAVCGLQLTFWENATNSSTDIFDLALFAYATRCLLEYRISQRESWLLRAVVVYAAGMTDTWVLIALAPAFLAALIWFRGLGFFQLRFLARVFLCSLAGLLFYLYLPLVHLRADGLFWFALKTNVLAELQPIVTAFRYLPHYVQFVLIFTSLLPILVIAIRWKSHFGDSSQFGAALTTWIFHLTHAVLLGVCIWAAFDTRFGLRDVQGKSAFLSHNRDRFLPLYYLSALSIGYLSGYFLLVFKPLSQSIRRITTAHKFLNGVSVGVICALLVLAPAGLFYKNLPQLRITNGPAWQQYASALTEKLPGRAVILSDRGDVLLAAQAWLAKAGKAANYVFLDTEFLKVSAYRRFQRAKHPDIWPTQTTNYPAKLRIGDLGMLGLMDRLSEKNPIYYLHSSFGATFEAFYPIPHGLVYELKEYPTNTMTIPPPLTDAVISENEDFWKAHDPTFREFLPALAAPAPGQKPTFRQMWMERMHIPFETNQTAVELGKIYSQNLNTLGVQDQKLGRPDLAGNHFAEAQEFYPDNVVAVENLDFNRKLQAGERIVAQSPSVFEDRFGNFSSWQPMLDVNGLFDEPTGCLAQGIVFNRGGLWRQAAQQFERALVFTPDSHLAQLWLARNYLGSRTPDKAFPLIDDLKAHSDSLSDVAITPGDVFGLELAADYITHKEDAATKLLKETWSRRPPDTNLLDIAFQVSVDSNPPHYTNALAVVEKQLALNPDDSRTLVNEGYIHLQLGSLDRSIGELTQVLSSEPTNCPALIDRAIAYLNAGKLDEAKGDYENLKNLSRDFKTPQQENIKRFAYYGLGEIAFGKKDTNAAIQNYEHYLQNAATNTPEAQFIIKRLKSLKSGSP